MPNLPYISPDILKSYQDTISKSASPATIKRKNISLNRFFDWAEEKGHIAENPFQKSHTEGGYSISNLKSQTEQPEPVVFKKTGAKTRTWFTVGLTTSIAVLVFLLVWKLKLPIPFINNFAKENTTQIVQNVSQNQNTITANPAGNSAWNLFAKLKITDVNGNPVVGSQSVNFKLFTAPTGGTSIYTSEAKTVTTDAQGSALISLDNVPNDIFFQNNKLYLEPQLASASSDVRIPVSTANTAANLGGYLPANPEVGAGPETIPVINSDGALLFAGESPAIKAKSGNLLVEGQTVTIKAADGSGNNIEINPDANGNVHLLFEGNRGNFVNAQAPNLTNGSLYYGMVPNNSTGYYLMNLQSGSKLTTKFSVDATGNTNINGGLSTKGMERLTATGALQNISGYSQTSGNFNIYQNPSDTASITKNGTALSDVLNLTLNENGITGSNHSTLVLNRFGGDDNSRALLVDSGNAQFDGQVQLGRYSSTPNSIGQASIIYNTADNLIYYYDGSAWQSLGTAVTTPFSLISTGTNSTAAMVIGTGASLGVAGTGTISATDLTCVGCVANSELANSAITINTSGILSGGTAVSLGGSINLTATEADTLDSVTGRSATTLNAVNVGNLTSTGTTTFGGVTYTWPATGTAGYVLQSGNTGASSTLSWVDPATAVAASIPWFQEAGVLYPKNNSTDVLIGSNATTSAKFAFKNVNSGTPTASISGSTANVSTFIDGNGNISTTNRNNLTLGNSTTYNTTGNILLNPNGTGNVGIGTAVPSVPLDVTGLIQSSSNVWTNAGTLRIGSYGSGYGLYTPTADIAFVHYRGAISVTDMVVKGTGDVGIGTTSPTALFDVAGAASVSGTLTFRAGASSIQTTAFNPLTIGGATTGNITFNPSNAVAGGSVAPGTTNVTDLGTASLLFRNIYGTALYQGVNQVCDLSGNCGATSGGSKWKLNLGTLSPYSDSLDVLIGSNATVSAKFAFKNVLTGTPTASISANSGAIATYLTGDGTLATTNKQNLTLGNSATYNTTGNVLINSNAVGKVGIGLTSPNSNLDVSGANIANPQYGGQFGQLFVRYSDAAAVNLGATIALGGAWDAGGSPIALGNISARKSGAAGDASGYLTLGTTNPSGSMTERVRITNVGNFGIGTTAPTGLLDISGSQNFTAFTTPTALTAGTPTSGGSCTPGTHSYKVTFTSVGGGETTAGTVSSQITCVLTTGQTVPLSAIPKGPTGTTGRNIYRTVTGDTGNYLLLTNLANNTATTYSDTSDDASLGAAAPASNTTAVANIQTGGTTRMVIDSTGNVGIGTSVPDQKLSVSGDADKSSGGTSWGTFSDIRLKNVDNNYTRGLTELMQIQPVMFHYKEGNPLNLPSGEQNYGFVAQDLQKVLPEAVTTSSTGYLRLSADPIFWTMLNSIKEQQGEITSISGQLAILSLTNTGDLNITKDSTGKYQLTNTSNNNIIDQITAFGQIITSNIKAGAVTIQEITTNSFTAFQGTVDNLLIKNGLVTPNVKVALISPLPNTTEITVQIGTSTESGKFVIQNSKGNEVAAIDSFGNATFSGTLVANEIKSKNLDDIQALLTKVQTDQNLLTQAGSWNIHTATNAASLNQLAMADLYVTNQAAINSLSVTNSMTIGSDLVLGSDNTLNSLTAPLKIQSLAMAPIEIMAGLVKIDTQGNVQIAGNLFVAGIIKTQTGFKIQDSGFNDVASIDASGSALFNSVSTQGLTISGADTTESGVIINGIITTNSTVGKAVIPAGVSEITINNPKVTDYTLVYVTPTSSTNNYVLFVKSKEAGKFTVGFTNPIDTDVNFNWWIVQVAK